jgi:hypothetical protein
MLQAKDKAFGQTTPAAGVSALIDRNCYSLRGGEHFGFTRHHYLFSIYLEFPSELIVAMQDKCGLNRELTSWVSQPISYNCRDIARRRVHFRDDSVRPVGDVQSAIVKSDFQRLV